MRSSLTSVSSLPHPELQLQADGPFKCRASQTSLPVGALQPEHAKNAECLKTVPYESARARGENVDAKVAQAPAALALAAVGDDEDVRTLPPLMSSAAFPGETRQPAMFVHYCNSTNPHIKLLSCLVALATLTQGFSAIAFVFFSFQAFYENTLHLV